MEGDADTAASPPEDLDLGLLHRVRAEHLDHPKRSFMDWLVGFTPEPGEPLVRLVEPARAGKVGICCSGGGIRSAAFNLGALQVLQRRGVLQQAKYLAAVSGGSYIAAGFATVAHTEGAPPADRKLLNDEHPPFGRGTPEELYLRNRSSYMAPGTSGKLKLVHQVLLGLIFNLLFICLFLFGAGLVLSIVYRATFDELGKADPDISKLPVLFWAPPLALAAAALLLGLIRVAWHFRKDRWRSFYETSSIRLLLAAAGVAVFTLAVPLLIDAIRMDTQVNPTEAAKAATSGTLAGISTIIAGVLLQVRAKVADPPRVLQGAGRVTRATRRAGAGVRMAFVYFAGAVVGPLLLFGFLILVVWKGTYIAEAYDLGWLRLAAALVVTGVVFGFLYLTADLTSWSLHPFYKRRLWSAFALRRVRDEQHHVHARERDYDQPLALSKSAVHPTWSKVGKWPTLVVCAAANISDTAATPPGRSVTTFTFSANAVGGPLVGAVETEKLEKLGRTDLDLMGAVAMSGAALSPSMGKMTLRPLRFLMALANVRLGVWVPNPRWEPRWKQGHGKKLPRPHHLVREMLGSNQLDAKYLYVTDGGHYENLGLVELLRRGCADVYCFDASGGESFTAIGDAIALARSELGVEIDIDLQRLVPTGERHLAPTDCVRGTIHFPADGVTGTLVYARTVMTAGAPWDVHAYHEADQTFPHNSTGDQLYTDQKFEAYRVLGDRAARTALWRMGVVAGTGLAGQMPESPTGWAPADPRCGGQIVAEPTQAPPG